ncbi:MAG TPA: acylphosphatase [Gammaproteobacteria bacterium]|nr:acylphosphatase [Gammaproteobacteria bacterium]
MSGEPVSRCCIVSGRVQGVFFRASTARRARELGVVGHALNLDDGRVEVLAIGPRAQVDALCAWLEAGPPAARVERVEVNVAALPDVPPATFSTG